MKGTRDLRAMLRRAAWRMGLLGFGWWALLENDLAGLAFGVPVVVIATLASLALFPRTAPSTHLLPAESVRLLATFLAGSLRGGCRTRTPREA
jgi:hypothetical protein